jgi:type II secretory pathway pseudopilin PulG
MKMSVFKRSGGFTLVELLASGMILSVAAVGIVNLLRLSDGASERGRLDARAALIFRDVVDKVASTPFADLRDMVNNSESTGPNGAIFEFGVPGGEFPFNPGEDAAFPKYLLYGRPLPGSSTPYGKYPYTVKVEVLDQVTYFDVRVNVSWTGFRDKIVGGTYEPAQRSVLLQFQKWGTEGT